MKFTLKRLWKPVEILIILVIISTILGLLNWLHHSWELSAFRSDLLPLAPTSAFTILFLCFCTLFSLSYDTTKYYKLIFYTLLGTIISYCMYVIVIRLGNLGTPIIDKMISGDRYINGIQLGVISPTTAFVAILTVISLLFNHKMHGKWKILQYVGLSVTILNILFCLTIILSFAAGMPIFFDSSVLTMALYSALAFFLLNFAILSIYGFRELIPGISHEEVGSSKLTSHLISSSAASNYILISFLILICGIVVLRFSYNAARNSAFQELKIIGDLKTDQISKWYQDKLADADVILNNVIVKNAVISYLKDKSNEIKRNEIEQWMLNRQQNYKYARFVLYDKQGTKLISIPNGSYKFDLLHDSSYYCALAENKICESDFQIDVDHSTDNHYNTRLNIWIPVSISSGKPQAIWLIQYDPALYLYPLIQNWPTYSKSGETLLVRREGNDVVYMNELRHKKNTAFRLRYSIDKYNLLPAVMAVKGKKGIVEGMDYRGKPVLAMIGTIPGTPWYSVSKIDRSEIYGPLRSRIWFILSFVILLNFLVAFMIRYREKNRDQLWLQRQYTLTRERQVYAERVANLTKYSNDIILTLDKNRNIIDVNQKAIDTYGYTEDELVKLNLDDLRLTSMRHLQSDFDWDSLAKEGIRMEITHLAKDGRHIEVEASIRSISIDDEILQQAIIRDITEHKRAEEALQISEENFRNIFTNSPVGISLTYMNGDLKVNKAFCDILGYTEEEFHAANWTEITYPDDIDVSQHHIDMLLAGEAKSVRFEKRYLHKNGSIVWVELQTTIQKDASNQPLFFLSSVSDITLKKQITDQLKETTEYLESLFNCANAPIIVWDNEYKITRFNHAFERMTGYESNEVIGMYLKILFPEVSRDVSFHKIMETSAGENWDVVEIPIQTKDDMVRIALWNSANIYSKDGSYLLTTIAQWQDITDRYNAEIALRLSEKDLNETQRIAKIGSWRLDLASNQVKWTNELYRMYDFDPELPPPPYTEHQKLFTRESWERLSTALANTTKTGNPYDLELETVRKDGSNGWMWVHGKVECDANGKIVGLLGAAQDITERKQVEVKLQVALERLQSVIDKVPFGAHTYVVDENNELIFSNFNLSANEILGFDHKPFIGRKIEEVFPMHATSEIPEIYRRVALTGEPFASIDYVYHDMTISGAYDIRAIQTGERRVTAFFMDVTERTKAEGEIRINQERLKMSQAIGHIGSWEYDLKSDTIWGSEESLRIYGLPQETSQMPIEQIEACIPEKERIHQALVDLIEEDKTYDLDFEIHPANHSATKIITSKAVLIRDENNNPMKVVGVIQDITDRKKTEEVIRLLNESLEQKVIDRTKQLSAAYKELEAFSYSVSHDLRTFLRGIDGWSMVLLEDYSNVLDAQGKRHLETIRAEAQNMGQVIDALLRLAHVSREEMEFEELNLSKMAEIVSQRLKSINKNRFIVVNIQPDMLDQGDFQLMEIVLIDLFDNAFKYTQTRNQARIEFGRSQIDGKLVYYIKDNGVGFDMLYVDKLFGTFQRLHKASDFAGTGIGLATVKRIINRHGGKIWANAEINKYAIFYFTLKEDS